MGDIVITSNTVNDIGKKAEEHLLSRLVGLDPVADWFPHRSTG